MKLLSAGIPGKNDYKEFMSKVVCDIEKHDCMLHSCVKCPNMSENERGISLANCALPVDEFVKEI